MSSAHLSKPTLHMMHDPHAFGCFWPSLSFMTFTASGTMLLCPGTSALMQLGTTCTCPKTRNQRTQPAFDLTIRMPYMRDGSLRQRFIGQSHGPSDHRIQTSTTCQGNIIRFQLVRDTYIYYYIIIIYNYILLTTPKYQNELSAPQVKFHTSLLS